MGPDGREFPIADFEISLTQSFIDSQVLKVAQPWKSEYFNGEFFYHDFL
jgi:hypothetical protein